MASPESMGRDCAQLIALAEAVAEFADGRDEPLLARRAVETARAARRFESEMVPIDRQAVTIYRHEFADLLRRLRP